MKCSKRADKKIILYMLNSKRQRPKTVQFDTLYFIYRNKIVRSARDPWTMLRPTLEVNEYVSILKDFQ